MAKVVKPGLNNVIDNINIREYSYRPTGGSVGSSAYDNIDYADVATPIAGLTNALPATNILSNVYSFIAQEITITFVDTLEAISQSLGNALEDIHIFDEVSYSEDGTVNNDTLPDDYNPEETIVEDESEAQNIVADNPTDTEEAPQGDQPQEEEEKPQEDEKPEEEKPQEEEQPLNPYINPYFEPSVTYNSDGSYTVSSSTGGFDANYLASNTYSSYECAKSARLIAHQRWGGKYFALGLGDAKFMAANARVQGIYKVSKEPSVGAIITFQPNCLGADSDLGHAAYVDKITYNKDGSIKSITIAQTHYSSKGHYYTYDYSEIQNNINKIDFISPKY